MAQRRSFTIRKQRPRRVFVKVSLTEEKDRDADQAKPASVSAPSITPVQPAPESPPQAQETQAVVPAAAPDNIPAVEEPARDEGPIPLGVLERLSAGANIIQAWREHLGLKPKDVAGRMGVVPGVFEQYERWGSKAPARTKSRIATALGISPELLEG
ncbi:MAG: helix-turn-helix transcriptional regulator [Syntrophaceae bacterium]